jgi:hypothetical protein
VRPWVFWEELRRFEATGSLEIQDKTMDNTMHLPRVEPGSTLARNDWIMLIADGCRYRRRKEYWRPRLRMVLLVSELKALTTST